MAIEVKKGNQLADPPNGAALKYVVTDTATGQYYATNAGVDGGGGGGSTAPYQVDGDFEIAVTEHQVFEYICFIGLEAPVDIIFETEEGTANIKTVTVADSQPLLLMTYMDADKTVYVKGAPAGTFIKTKFS